MTTATAQLWQCLSCGMASATKQASSMNGQSLGDDRQN